MLKDKKAVLNWLFDENAISVEENVLYAEKAFFVSTVVSWCAEQVKKGNMSTTQVNQCMKLLRKFLRGKIELCWKDGTIIIPDKDKKEVKMI